MPSNGKFGFSVVVDGVELPEYQKDGLTYVESNLWTPVSYKQLVRELAYGEIEEQEWPVTPYQIKVTVQSFCPESWCHVYVDGTKVDWNVLGGSKTLTWTSEGFRTSEGTTEYLFALPRFARDENDRVTTDRKSKIGTIEVIRCEATYLEDKYGGGSGITFNQANKKDTIAVTEGKHTMSTTKQGKILRAPSSGGKHQVWTIGQELGGLCVHYHMGHTLKNMGIEVEEIDWKSRAQPAAKCPKHHHH